jgi:hypothetical protein
MKVIWTKNIMGKCSAHDGDGNRITIHVPSAQFEDGHKAAAIALCDKMNWQGELIGGHVLKGGVNNGMAWVWVDDSSPRIVAPSTMPNYKGQETEGPSDLPSRIGSYNGVVVWSMDRSKGKHRVRYGLRVRNHDTFGQAAADFALCVEVEINKARAVSSV